MCSAMMGEAIGREEENLSTSQDKHIELLTNHYIQYMGTEELFTTDFVKITANIWL